MRARPISARLPRCAASAALLGLSLAACAGTPSPGTPAAAPPVSAPQPAPPLAQPASSPAALPRLVPTDPPAELGTVERFAWQRVTEFGEAFSAGDVEGFLSKVSRGFYRGYATLETSLKTLIGDSTERTAVVAVRRVTTEDGRVIVRAQWTRSVTRRNGTVQAASGETEFLFLKNDTSLRLLDYRGDTPFAIDGI